MVLTPNTGTADPLTRWCRGSLRGDLRPPSTRHNVEKNRPGRRRNEDLIVLASVGSVSYSIFSTISTIFTRFFADRWMAHGVMMRTEFCRKSLIDDSNLAPERTSAL
jgi:hypothetical protein